MKNHFILFILLIISLVSCRHRAQEANQAQKSYLNEKSGFRFDDFHLLDSLKRNDIVVIWRNYNRLIDSVYLKDSVRTVVDRIDTILINGKNIYAVQTESRPPEMDFHTAGALCLISFFEQDNTVKQHFIKSSILYSDAPLLMGGSWGSFPKTELIQIGPHRYAYMVEPGFAGQGVSSTAMLIFEITDSLELPEVFILNDMHYDNGGICSDTDANIPKCFSYSTTMEFINKSYEYYDIKAHLAGTKIVDDKIINIDSTFYYTYYYTYKDRRYELIKTVVNEKNTDSK